MKDLTYLYTSYDKSRVLLALEWQWPISHLQWTYPHATITCTSSSICSWGTLRIALSSLFWTVFSHLIPPSDSTKRKLMWIREWVWNEGFMSAKVGLPLVRPGSCGTAPFYVVIKLFSHLWVLFWLWRTSEHWLPQPFYAINFWEAKKLVLL